MPMVGSGLAAVIKSAVSAIPEAGRTHDAVWNAIGDAIVTYIQANAVVTVAVASATALTPAAPGTGVGVIT
jgi:hypothetical protein